MDDGEIDDFKAHDTGGVDVDGMVGMVGEDDAEDDAEASMPLSAVAGAGGFTSGMKRAGEKLESDAARLKTAAEDAREAAVNIEAASDAAACVAQSVHTAAAAARTARARVKTAEEALGDAERTRALYDTAVQNLDDLLKQWQTVKASGEPDAAVRLANGSEYRNKIETARTAVQKAGNQWLKAANAYRKQDLEALVKRVSAAKDASGKRTYTNKGDALLRSPELKAASSANDADSAADQRVVDGVNAKLAEVTAVLRGLNAARNASMKADKANKALEMLADTRDIVADAQQKQQTKARAAVASASVARQRSTDADSGVRGAAKACGQAAELLEREGADLASECKGAVENLAMMRYELQTMMIQYDKYIQQAEAAIEAKEAESDPKQKCKAQDLAAMKEALRVAKATFDELDAANVEHIINESMAKFDRSTAGLKAKKWDDATYVQKWEDEIADEEVSEDEPEGDDDEDGGEEGDGDVALEQLADSSIACTVRLTTNGSAGARLMAYPVPEEALRRLAKHLRKQIAQKVLPDVFDAPIEVAVDMPVEAHEMVVTIRLAERFKAVRFAADPSGAYTEWGQLLQDAREAVEAKEGDDDEEKMDDEERENAIRDTIAAAYAKLDAFRAVPFLAEVAIPSDNGKQVQRLLRWINGHLREYSREWFGARAEVMPDFVAKISDEEELELNAAYSSEWKARAKREPAFYEQLKMHVERIRDREAKSDVLGIPRLQGRIDTVIGTLEFAAQNGGKDAKRRLTEVNELVETIKRAGLDEYVAGWTVASKGKRWYDRDAVLDADKQVVTAEDKWALLVRFLQSEALEYEGDEGDEGDA